MATTTKTLTPTNQTITLPDMTERPNASILVDGIGKDADAINALSDHITTLDNYAIKWVEAETMNQVSISVNVSPLGTIDERPRMFIVECAKYNDGTMHSVIGSYRYRGSTSVLNGADISTDSSYSASMASDGTLTVTLGVAWSYSRIRAFNI